MCNQAKGWRNLKEITNEREKGKARRKKKWKKGKEKLAKSLQKHRLIGNYNNSSKVLWNNLKNGKNISKYLYKYISQDILENKLK